jgi:hypothetical protein
MRAEDAHMSPELERLIGRAVMDKEFRDQLLNDPEGAAKAAGFNLSDAELEQLKSLIERYKAGESSPELDSIDSKLRFW